MKRTVFALLFVSLTAVAVEPRKLLWQDPQPIETRDIVNGTGGPELVPAPPFSFQEEDHSGTQPKIKVKDAKGRDWAVKFGAEALPECFASRLAWMVGYLVEPTYCLVDAHVSGVRDPGRAKKYVREDGTLSRGRFEIRSKEPEFLPLMDWGWRNNPFLGTRELQGLKIMILLVSNWDNKDERNRYGDGSNNGVFEVHEKPPALLYEVIDWGASLGRWGNVATRSKCDCKGYTEQHAHFIEGVKKGIVHWGYHGKHSEDAKQDITVDDVRWLMKYLGKITDEQLKAGLVASAATPEETECFQREIRARIEQLRSIAGAPAETATPAN
jgi:hypothetical protein